MRLEIDAPGAVKSSAEIKLRAVLFNDSYEPVAVSRNAFVGPSLRTATAGGGPFPESVEPTFGGPEEPLTLQPFSFYGRERTYSGLSPGEFEVTAAYRGTEERENLKLAKRMVVEAG